MVKIHVQVIFSAFLMVGWSNSAWSQDSIDKPLGDAAREQREVHQTTKAEKLYENKDVEPSPSPHRGRDAETPLENASKPPTKPAGSTLREPKSNARETGESHRGARRSVLDHRTDEEEADESLIVPVGTELKVEIPAASDFPQGVYVGRVAAPVRLGFSTPIPALSIANIKVVGRYYPLDASYYTLSYFEALEVTQVIVEGVPYAVQTDRVGRASSFASAELTFRLLMPLAIQR